MDIKKVRKFATAMEKHDMSMFLDRDYKTSAVHMAAATGD